MKKFLLSIFAVLFAFAGVQAQETVTDVLSATKFAATSTSYADFTNVKFNSDAVYAGNSAKTSGGAIQLRSKNSNSGIVTTVSGGKAKSVTIVVESGSNTLDIYGSNTPFSAAGDLYNTTATKLGSLSASGTLNITGDYEYIGLRSKSGALYLTSISIVWETNGEGGEETPEAPAAPTLPAACNFDDAMTVEITGIAEGATAFYSLNDENNWIEGSSVEITETTTVYAKVVKDGVSSTAVSETYTKNTPVTPPAEGEVVDVLNRELTGISGTSYSSWSGKTVTSDAVYAGQSAGGNDAIQLRSNNNNSGVITTASGGKVRKVAVEWQSNTSNGRTLNVYGKNTAYSAPTDLYDDSKQGTLLGTIVYGTSTELVIEGDYEYIGLRSNNGALYLTSISIVWEINDGPSTAKLPGISVANESTIALGDEITISPAVDNTVTYSVNNGDPIQITETTTITADKAGVMTLSIASTCNDETLTAEYTYDVKPAMPTMTDAVGFEESLDVEIEGEGVIYYTLNGDDPTTESDIYDGAIIITETTTVKAIAVVDGVESDIASVTYAKLLTATPGYTVDMLTRETTGASGTTYTDWEGKTLNSTAVYAGESAGGNDAIQLRSTNPSGIVTTVSGGKAVKVVVTWNSNTGDRTLDIYGKNSAYESPADLYSTSTRGTKIGSIAKGSTTLEISGDYLYIGIRSNSGALYLDDIEITWANPYKLKVSEVGYATMFLGFDAAIPTIEGEENGVFTATESETVGYVHLNSVEGVLPAETGVIVKAAAGTYEFWPSTGATADVTGNLLKGSVAATEIDVEAYVLGNVDGVGLYKAQMTDGVWLNNANKAYLPASAVPNKSAAFYGFDWNGTTGVEKVEIRNEKSEIYDLTGRRIEAITAPGIYVVNGKKILVK